MPDSRIGANPDTFFRPPAVVQRSPGSRIVTSDRTDATLHLLEFPLLHPFETASGSVMERTVGLVSVSRGGVTGWGEAAPYPGQDERFEDVVGAARTGGLTPTLAAAIDEAVCDLGGRERGEAISAGLGGTRIEVPISLAVGMDARSIDKLDDAVSAKVTRVKVKVMPGRTSHVGEIRRRFPTLTIGVDANGSFDGSNWTEMLDLLDHDVAYVEAPFASLDRPEVAALSEAGALVFADESVRSVATAREALETPGVAGIVVKPGRLGWHAAVAAVQMARSTGKKWRGSGLLESGVGRAFTAALASADDAYLSDVAPADWFFSYDVAPQAVVDGSLIVPTGPGIGVDVDIDAVRDRALEVIPLSGSVVPDPG